MARHHHAEINPQVRDARQKQQNRHWENYRQRHDGQHHTKFYQTTHSLKFIFAKAKFLGINCSICQTFT